MTDLGIKTRMLAFIEYKKLSIAAFERENGLSNGYIKNIRKGIRTDILENILRKNPELNRDWLLNGVGEMLNGNISQEINGNNTISGHVIAGHGAKIESIELSKRLEDEISALKDSFNESLKASLTHLEKLQVTFNDQLKTKDEQINRLLSLLEKMN